MHSPHKVYIDELCGSGLLQASAVWWPPGGAEAVKQVDINLGRSCTIGLLLAPVASLFRSDPRPIRLH